MYQEQLDTLRLLVEFLRPLGAKHSLEYGYTLTFKNYGGKLSLDRAAGDSIFSYVATLEHGSLRVAIWHDSGRRGDTGTILVVNDNPIIPLLLSQFKNNLCAQKVEFFCGLLRRHLLTLATVKVENSDYAGTVLKYASAHTQALNNLLNPDSIQESASHDRT